MSAVKLPLWFKVWIVVVGMAVLGATATLAYIVYTLFAGVLG